MKCFVGCVLCCLVPSMLAASARAEFIASYTVGTGASTSYLEFQFTNSHTYLYEVRYDGTLHGNDLLAIAAAAQPGYFAYTTEQFSFGIALLGVSIGADADSGFGNPPDYLDYWHYWTREAAGDAWTESWTGFGDRTVSNGSWDGWVFNSAGAPAAVPAPGALALAVLAGLGRRRAR